MLIEKGKAIFEIIECWNCKGKKEVTRYNICPNCDKRMGQSCKICGKTKEEPSHRYLNSYQVKCNICDGEGTRLENRFDNDINHVIQTIPIILETSKRDLTWVESYLGLNNVFSTTDYGRHWKLSDEEFLNMLKGELLTSMYKQYCSFIDKDLNVARKLVAVRKQSGYIINAIWEK